MSSAFNLSTLVAMQDQRVEPASVHFWRCQLTRDSPRCDWNPDAKAPVTGDKVAKDTKDGDVSEDIEEEEEEEEEGVSTRHLLHVTGCVLGPKAEGIHLVTVRTQPYHQKSQAPATEPEPCPILCLDPAVQRTLALGHEFVLEPGRSDAGGGCAFELAEGSGPVWLTGTHRVHRVVPVTAAGDFGEDEEDEEEEEDEAAGSEDEEEDIGEESEAEEEDDDEELIEEVKPARKLGKGKGKAASGPAAKSKPPAAQKQSQVAADASGKQQRKRAKPDS